MLLQRLNEYAGRLDLPPALYSKRPVRYIIELDASGRLLNPQPTDTADPSNKKTQRGQPLAVPYVSRSYNVKALLLAHDAEYTLGLARSGSKPNRVVACHHAYLELLERCALATQEPTVKAVRAFLEGDPASHLELPEKFDRNALITFRVDGIFPLDRPSVQRFWKDVNDPSLDTSKPVAVMQCLVCGETRPVLERLPTKLKGIPGGRTIETALISANQDAFLSYGLKASQIAPTCAACAERFTKAANDLLASDASRITLGRAAFIFWTRRPVEFSFLSALSDPQADEVRALIDSARKGALPPEVDDTAFYATTLTTGAGRAVVRDWIDTSVGEAQRHLAMWFRRQLIVGPGGQEPRPFGIARLASGTVRRPDDLNEARSRAIFHALVDSALTGTGLPHWLLYQAIHRIKAERKGDRKIQAMTHERAALIKMVLCGMRPTLMEESMTRLDPDNSNVAYQCGRLLAVIEEVQEQAIQGINITVADKNFAAASTRPATVFGRLLAGAKPHLTKLRRDRLGAYYALQSRLDAVTSVLPPSLPAVLRLEEQSLFALGYYHQRAFDRAHAHAAIAKRKASPGDVASTAAHETTLNAVSPSTDREEH